MTKKTVMIVEDDLIHMKLFHDVLEAQGYETVRCPDGENTLEIAVDENPDLILLDIRLPNVSGFDIIKEFRNNEKLKHTPVIAVSGFADKFEEVDYLIKGFDGFIPKPIAVPKFISTIAKFINPELFPN